MEFETIIGLEVHAELSTKTKAFCGCANEFGSSVNANCCPVCMAMPGALPVLNKKVVEYGIKAGLAMNCSITQNSKQDRKNYFYPDLPKAFQVSQYDLPFSTNGSVKIKVDGTTKKIGIVQIHIEEDAGKLIHDVLEDKSLIDYNRAGVPLIEIVSEPDLRSPEEARLYLEEIKSILQCIDVSDCKMNEGSLRCDVNVSVRPIGQKEFGVKTEMKNLSSFRAVYRAIEFETKRQIEIIKSGNKVITETRRWSDAEGVNYTMRAKRVSTDYRCFADPDLAKLAVDDKWLEEIKSSIPELPSDKAKRYMDSFGIGDYDAGLIASNKSLAVFFESCTTLGANPKTVANWILGDISRLLNETQTDPSDLRISPANMVEFIELIEKDTISNTAGKKVIEEMFINDKNPKEIVKQQGLEQVSDTETLRKMAEEIVSNNPKSVADYKRGKTNVLGFLVGQVMRASKGKANPQILNSMIKDILDRS